MRQNNFQQQDSKAGKKQPWERNQIQQTESYYSPYQKLTCSEQDMKEFIHLFFSTLNDEQLSDFVKRIQMSPHNYSIKAKLLDFEYGKDNFMSLMDNEIQKMLYFQLTAFYKNIKQELELQSRKNSSPHVMH